MKDDLIIGDGYIVCPHCKRGKIKMGKFSPTMIRYCPLCEMQWTIKFTPQK